MRIISAGGLRMEHIDDNKEYTDFSGITAPQTEADEAPEVKKITANPNKKKKKKRKQ